MKTYRLLILVCAVTLLLPFTGSNRALGHEELHLQFAHLAPTVATVDIYIGDKAVVQGLAYREVSAVVPADSAEIMVQVVPAGGMMTDALLPQPVMLKLDVSAQNHFVIALVGSTADQTLDLVSLAGELPPVKQNVGVATSGSIKVSAAFARPTAVKPMAGMGDMATPEATMAGMDGMATPEATMSGMGGGSEMTMATSAAYMLIENTGDTPDKLVGVSCDVAQMTQLHQTVVENDVARMQEVTGGLEIPAKGSVELKPGSYHIMLMQLNHDLVVGDLITVTLTFESGTKLDVTVPVKQM